MDFIQIHSLEMVLLYFLSNVLQNHYQNDYFIIQSHIIIMGFIKIYIIRKSYYYILLGTKYNPHRNY